MKKFFAALALAVPLAVLMTALISIAADQVPGTDVKSVQAVGGRDSTGKARAVQVAADGSLVISGLVGGSSTIQTAQKGAAAAGSITSTTASADRQPMDVTLYNAAGTPVGTAVNPVVVNMRVGYMKTGAPSFSVSASTASASATGLSAGGCYRVACSAATFFRSGSGSITAVTTDNPLYGPTVEKVCIPSTDTVLAFVTSTGTATCTGTLYSVTP